MNYRKMGVTGFSFILAAIALLVYLPIEFETGRMFAAMMGGTGIFFAVMYVLTTGSD